uniref:Uncharacterized protein n=1 Tax=Romanomermis culicivorax TaxID=13658 RepID=A0A915HZ83_ROMCU
MMKTGENHNLGEKGGVVQYQDFMQYIYKPVDADRFFEPKAAKNRFFLEIHPKSHKEALKPTILNLPARKLVATRSYQVEISKLIEFVGATRRHLRSSIKRWNVCRRIFCDLFIRSVTNGCRRIYDILEAFK